MSASVKLSFEAVSVTEVVENPACLRGGFEKVAVNIFFKQFDSMPGSPLLFFFRKENRNRGRPWLALGGGHARADPHDVAESCPLTSPGAIVVCDVAVLPQRDGCMSG